MSTPAERIIEKCGGVAAVARLTGRTENRVRRWTYPRSRGGTGGLIPSDVQPLLLRKARAEGIDVGPEDFFAPEVLEAPSGREGAAA